MSQALLAVLIGAGALRMAAQEIEPVRVPDAVTCPACRITTTPIATLGQEDGPGSFTLPPDNVRVDSRGRFWVVGGRDDAVGPAVFGPDGRFLGVVGRRGQGPGEFQNVHDAIMLPGDSALVMDGNFRATVVGPDLVPRRFMTIPAPLQNSLVVDWPSVVTGFSHAGLRGGPTLHVISFNGPTPRVVRSFGPAWSMTERRSQEATIQRVSESRSGLWSAWQRRYRIDHWSREFGLDRRLERAPEWFSGESRGIGPSQPPPPRLNAVLEDEVGQLWTFVAVATPTWKEAWPKPRSDGTMETRMAAVEIEKLWRTIVEVIDPVAGRVVARRELDQQVVVALPGPLAVLYTADADGIVRLRVVRLTLQGP